MTHRLADPMIPPRLPRPGRILLVVLAGAVASACGGEPTMTELQRVRSGTLDVVLLSPNEALREGQDALTIEFRSAADGTLVDVGAVTADAAMPMAGMAPMMGDIQVQPSGVKGRYAAATDLEMAGTWRVTIDWEGPAGRGSTSFVQSVQ